ncbi:MAG: CDP-glucose 4,6-dehydratase, partial [Lachnospiraceae bacterium]|nr:CDP-glucose 4,6-dehydratase [Lachnospiraceae bacterium]
AVTTGALSDKFCSIWNRLNKDNALHEASWESRAVDGPHEANLLRLDCTKLKRTFNWKPVWTIDDTMEKTVSWYMEYVRGGNVLSVMEKQIAEFLK